MITMGMMMITMTERQRVHTWIDRAQTEGEWIKESQTPTGQTHSSKVQVLRKNGWVLLNLELTSSSAFL